MLCRLPLKLQPQLSCGLLALLCLYLQPSRTALNPKVFILSQFMIYLKSKLVLGDSCVPEESVHDFSHLDSYSTGGSSKHVEA